MDKIWAPWRSRYIYLKKRKRCIFCGARNARDTGKRYIVDRTRHSFSMLNMFPYNNAHVMVSPYRHVRSLEELDRAEMTDLFELVNATTARLTKEFKPHGFNIGVNIGRVAGAGYEGHVHVHIVPRWLGDSNFMPVVANTKVVSDSLDSVYKRLKKR
ncbi:MAG: HIT domain-containing protein [Candidatus Omnitrophica bacterium]|nr:HIT domain-containing protein [Candidatus Omnitrophota bacterium]